MTEETNGGSAETTAPESTDVDTQLAEMQTAESSTPDPQETPEPAEKPEVKKVVPLAALHEERRERQRLQAEIAAERRQYAEQMARVNQRLEMLTPRPQAPDKDTQPVDYLDHRLNELSQAQRAIMARDQDREAQAQQQRVVASLTNAVLTARAEFEKTTPDVSDAANYMNEMRSRELMALGAPEAQARLQATQELDQALLTWAHEGRNPVQTAYEFAKARGYTPKLQQASEKIAALQKGTAAAKSLGGGGSVSGGKLTAEALANMSEEEFAKLTPSQWRQAMGG